MCWGVCGRVCVAQTRMEPWPPASALGSGFPLSLDTGWGRLCLGHKELLQVQPGGRPRGPAWWSRCLQLLDGPAGPVGV